MIITKVQKHRKQSKVMAAQASPAISATVPHAGTTSQSQIRERAYQIYESHGSKSGHDIQDWLHAERRIQGR